jgi:hypothetical protein
MIQELKKQRRKVMSNLFAQAAVVKEEKITKKKGEKERVEIGTDLDMVAGIKAFQDQLKGVYDVYYQKVTEKMREHFVDEAVKTGRRPDSFRGIGGFSEASCELRTRSERSALSPAEVAVLTDNKIPVDKVSIVEEIPERFFFNPDLILSELLTQKISEALEGIPELKGRTIIMKQEKRAPEYKMVVAEGSFDEIAKIKDKEVVGQLMEIIGTTAIKPSYKGSLDTIIDILRKTGVL